jgi:hypothetical protein
MLVSERRAVAAVVVTLVDGVQQQESLVDIVKPPLQ